MANQLLKDFDLDSFATALGAETDRACAVLGAAILDAKLNHLFQLRLRGEQGELLPSARALGSFSTKITLAYALGWMDAAARSEFHIIRRIRNLFAHSFDHNLSFSAPAVHDLCQNLQIPVAVMSGMDEAANTATNVSSAVIFAMLDVLKPARQRFELSVSFLTQHIDALDHSPGIYGGPDLLAESHTIGAKTRLQIRASATVGPPPRSEG